MSLPTTAHDNVANGTMGIQRVHRIPRRLKGCRNLRKVLSEKERDLADEFRRVHRREPTYLEREVIEVAMNHLSRGAGLARLLDLDFTKISHSDKVTTWERSGNAHEAYLKAISRLGLDRAAGKLTFKQLMEVTAKTVENKANGVVQEMAQVETVIVDGAELPVK